MRFNEKASVAFIGTIYIIIGLLILKYPQFFYYWVAGVFLIHGIFSLVRGLRGYLS